MNKQLIIQRYKNPKNWSDELEDKVGQSVNASCGDEISLSLKIKENVVVDGKYNGMGCSICLACADILIDNIKGKKKEEILKLDEKYILGLIDMDVDSPRKRCASLSLEAVINAINVVE